MKKVTRKEEIDSGMRGNRKWNDTSQRRKEEIDSGMRGNRKWKGTIRYDIIRKNEDRQTMKGKKWNCKSH